MFMNSYTTPSTEHPTEPGHHKKQSNVTFVLIQAVGRKMMSWCCVCVFFFSYFCKQILPILFIGTNARRIKGAAATTTRPFVTTVRPTLINAPNGAQFRSISSLSFTFFTVKCTFSLLSITSLEGVAWARRRRAEPKPTLIHFGLACELRFTVQKRSCAGRKVYVAGQSRRASTRRYTDRLGVSFEPVSSEIDLKFCIGNRMGRGLRGFWLRCSTKPEAQLSLNLWRVHRKLLSKYNIKPPKLHYIDVNVLSLKC